MTNEYEYFLNLDFANKQNRINCFNWADCYMGMWFEWNGIEYSDTSKAGNFDRIRPIWNVIEDEDGEVEDVELVDVEVIIRKD